MLCHRNFLGLEINKADHLKSRAVKTDRLTDSHTFEYVANASLRISLSYNVVVSAMVVFVVDGPIVVNPIVVVAVVIPVIIILIVVVVIIIVVAIVIVAIVIDIIVVFSMSLSLFLSSSL